MSDNSNTTTDSTPVVMKDDTQPTKAPSVVSGDVTSPSKVKTKKGKSQGRGRPATVTDKAFIEVHAKSESLDDIIKTFKALREMDPKKARLYVTMRSASLRKKGVELKQFPRGRKPSKQTEVLPTTPIME